MTPADSRDTAPGRTTGPELRHEPALDGLRGLAVLAVVIFHLGRIDGGFLGVDLFFALSGFLITSLLLVERERSGRIGLGRFWARRARRLFPALVLMLAGVAILLLLFTPAEQRPDFRWDMLWTWLYAANWNSLADDAGYWDMFSQASPLDHAWSLAIEEQFYVVWPLVFLAAVPLGRHRRLSTAASAGICAAVGTIAAAGLLIWRPTIGQLLWAAAWPAMVLGVIMLGRRRQLSTGTTVGIIAAAGAIMAFGALAWTYEPFDTNRAYFGTDTRIGPTLLGVFLAVLCVRRPRRERPPRPGLDAAALVALAFLIWAMYAVSGEQGIEVLGWELTSFYYRGGLLVFGLAAMVVMTGVTGGPLGWTGRLLAVRPLRALGLISYGVYLWHWPVIVYLDPTYRDWLPQRPRNVELLGTTVNLTEVGIDVARVAVSLGLAIASYKLLEQPIRQRTWEMRIGGRRLLLIGGTVTVAVFGLTMVATWGSSSADGDDGGGGIPDMNTDRETIYPDDEAAFSDDAPRLLLVGDSGALTTGDDFMEHGQDRDVAVAYAADPECTIVYPEGLVLHANGETDGPGRCHDDRWDEITGAVETFRPDTVVYYFANAGMLEYLLDGEPVDDCDPAHMDYLESALTEELAHFAAEGIDVAFMTSPYIGTMDETSPERVDCRNEVYTRLENGPYAPTVVDLNGFITDLTDQPDVESEDIFSDWVHLNDDGGHAVAEWLFPQLYPDR